MAPGSPGCDTVGAFARPNAVTATTAAAAAPLLDLTDFKRDLSELTDRLRSRGRAAIAGNVHRALRCMADEDQVIESVTPIVRHLNRREIEESGTITYELALAEAAE